MPLVPLLGCLRYGDILEGYTDLGDTVYASICTIGLVF